MKFILCRRRPAGRNSSGRRRSVVVADAEDAGETDEPEMTDSDRTRPHLQRSTSRIFSRVPASLPSSVGCVARPATRCAQMTSQRHGHMTDDRFAVLTNAHARQSSPNDVGGQACRMHQRQKHADVASVRFEHVTSNRSLISFEHHVHHGHGKRSRE